MVVSDADARLEHLSRDYLANLHMKRIRTAIDDYRRMRSSDALLRGGLYALGATVVLALGIVLLVLLGRWLDKVLSERAKSRIHTVGIQSFEIVRAEQIWKALHGMLYAVRVGAMLVLLFVYLHVVLALFPWTRGIANRLFGLVAGALGHMGKAVVARIPDLLILAIIYYLFRFVLRLIRHFFEAVDRKAVTLPGFDAEWAIPTYKIVRFAVIAFGLIVAYPYIPGSQSAAFKGISLFVGVVFSLGSSTAISNIIAGYLMTYRRVFKVGDRVKVGDVFGDVIATQASGDAHPYPQERRGDHSEFPDTDRKRDELQFHGRYAGADPPHHGRHRLRDPLAAGGGDAVSGRQSARRGCSGSLARSSC